MSLDFHYTLCLFLQKNRVIRTQHVANDRLVRFVLVLILMHGIKQSCPLRFSLSTRRSAFQCRGPVSRSPRKRQDSPGLERENLLSEYKYSSLFT